MFKQGCYQVINYIMYLETIFCQFIKEMPLKFATIFHFSQLLIYDHSLQTSSKFYHFLPNNFNLFQP